MIASNLALAKTHNRHSVNLNKQPRLKATTVEVGQLDSWEVQSVMMAHFACGASAILKTPRILHNTFDEPVNKALAAYLDFSVASGKGLATCGRINYQDMQEALANLPEGLEVPQDRPSMYLVAFYMND